MRTTKIRQKSRALIAGLVLAVLLAFAPLAGAQVCTPTADDVVFDQMTFIAGLALPCGIQNMLYVELQEALVGIAESDVEAAVAALEDFSNKVENQSGGQIDAADAVLMLAAAEATVQLLTEVTCPCLAGFPEFAAFLADPSNIDGCSRENQFIAVSLYTIPVTQAITVGGSPNFPDAAKCAWVDVSSGDPPIELPVTYEEAEACSALLFEAAAAVGVTCSNP